MRTIEEIKAAAAAARGQAAQALTGDQAALVEALAEEQDAQEALAAELTKLRGLVLAERVEKARAAAAGAYLVQGIDLVGLHPLGSFPVEPSGLAPSLPGGGAIVIRSPDIETADSFARDAEAKKKGLSSLAAKLTCDVVVDPDKNSPEGTKLLGYCQKYPEAAGTIAGRAKKLGGQQEDATKRGRG